MVIASLEEARQSHSNVIPAKAGIQILDHPVKSQRDPADRMMTVVADEIASDGTGSNGINSSLIISLLAMTSAAIEKS
jgi:hypothetical protein